MATPLLYLAAGALFLLSRRSRKKAPTPSKEVSPLTVFPVEGKLTSGFGSRTHPIYHVKKFHKGLDIGAPTGTPVFAAGNGVVIFAGMSGADIKKSYGNLIKIDHGDGLVSRYGHLSKILVKKGDQVIAGQKIGLVGSTGISTGPHLHFEVRKNDEPIDPRTLVQMPNS